MHLVRDPVLDAYVGGRWHRQHVIRGVLDLDRLRYPPTGDRALWVRYGPSVPATSNDTKGWRAA